jgi:hypothetical protein
MKNVMTPINKKGHRNSGEELPKAPVKRRVNDAGDSEDEEEVGMNARTPMQHQLGRISEGTTFGGGKETVPATNHKRLKPADNLSNYKEKYI